MSFTNRLVESTNPAAFALLKTVVGGLSGLKEGTDYTLVSKRRQDGSGGERYHLIATALGDGDTLDARYTALNAALTRLAPMEKVTIDGEEIRVPKDNSLTGFSATPAPGIGTIDLEMGTADELIEGIQRLGARLGALEYALPAETLMHARAQAAAARDTAPSVLSK